MSTHRLDGIRTTPLASYLAGLGLVRVLGQQGPGGVQCWWEGDSLCVDTEVDDLAGWLVDQYVPTPVLSPWNGGSGFGEKDRNQRQALERLIGLESDRLDPYRAAMESVVQVLAGRSADSVDKLALVRSLRNRAPDALLEWIDAAVIVLEDDLAFPPLLGTGGNDGRLDFSSNFHQRLLDVLDPGAAARLRSRNWAVDLLTGSAVQPRSMSAIGQFDPWSAGGKSSTIYGAGESLVNPWQFVLTVEGAMVFASATARRLSGEKGRAAMPFTVNESSAGSDSGADGEKSRGEIWMPVWTETLSYPEVRQIFREARASWQGRTATRAAQMYEATKTLGVDHGVDRFVRYGFHERNGLAYVAASLDEVTVRYRPEVLLIAPIETWLDRVSPKGVQQTLHHRIARRYQIEFARTGQSSYLLALMETVARLHLTIEKSGTDSVRASPLRMPAAPVITFLKRVDALSPELLVAIGIAARTLPDEGGGRGRFADIVLPIRSIPRGPDWGKTRVSGFGVRPVVDVIADVMVWRASRSSGTWRTHGAVVPVRGHLPFDRAFVRTPLSVVAAWARQPLMDEVVERALLAMCLLDWREDLAGLLDGADRPWLSDPALAQLTALSEGLAQPRDTRGSVPDEVYGWRPDWPTRLRADQTGVLREAAQVCRQAGWDVAGAYQPAVSGRRLLAAIAAAPDHSRGALELTLITVPDFPAERHDSDAPTHNA